MNTAQAVAALEELLETDSRIGQQANYLEWRTKALGVIRAVSGIHSPEYVSFSEASTVRRENYTLARGPIRDREMFTGDAVSRGKGVIRGIVSNLRLNPIENPLTELTVDPELWSHVRVLVEQDQWEKIPADVVIFVEDRVRKWSGNPRVRDGAMTGQTLMGNAFGEAGELRLGAQSSEWQGWRSLGTGLVQAIGNVDRHHIQRRPDARRYALGVLGLGSLLLTQLRYEHSELIERRERSEPSTGDDDAGEPVG